MLRCTVAIRFLPDNREEGREQSSGVRPLLLFARGHGRKAPGSAWPAPAPSPPSLSLRLRGRYPRVQEVLEPLGLAPLLERQVDGSAHPPKELEDGLLFGGKDAPGEDPSTFFRTDATVIAW
jgi:hypothetical protein